MTYKTETVPPVVWLVMPDGTKVGKEYTKTTIDNWRETPFGRINFGKVYLYPSKLVQCVEPI